MFERLLAENPLPWGVMNTAIELVKSKSVNFRGKDYFGNTNIE